MSIGILTLQPHTNYGGIIILAYALQTALVPPKALVVGNPSKVIHEDVEWEA